MSSPIADRAYLPPLLGGADLERRARNLRRWRRHSALIYTLRGLLPTAAVVLLVGLVGWAGVNTFLRLSGANRAQSLAIRLVNPKFFGRDGRGRPYFLGAQSAVRDNQQLQKIYLEGPVVVMGDPSDVQSKVTADKGVYREDTRILVLDGHVHAQNSKGDEFLSPNALVDTVTNDIDGQAQIQGRGPSGAITASTYAVRNGGAQVFFTGRVSAHIEQSVVAAQSRAAAAPGGPLRGPR